MGVRLVQSHIFLWSEGFIFSLMLCCHLLEILNNFKQEAMNFHFVEGPANYVANLILGVGN